MAFVNYSDPTVSDALSQNYLNNFLGGQSYNNLGNYGLANNSSSSWFGNSGILNGLVNLGGLGLQGYFGLQSAKLAKEQLGLAKNQFGFEKALANRNLANQAKTINNVYDNAAQISAGLVGSVNPDGTIGATDAATAQQIIDSAKNKYVEGSPIR